MECEERPLADLDQHVSKLLLDELEGCNGPAELLPLDSVGQRGLVAVPGRPHRAPDDAVPGFAQAGEWSAEAPGPGQHRIIRKADVLEPYVALDRSPHRELGGYVCGREPSRICWDEEASDGVILFIGTRPDDGDVGDGGKPDPTLLPVQDPVGAVLPGEGPQAGVPGLELHASQSVLDRALARAPVA